MLSAHGLVSNHPIFIELFQRTRSGFLSELLCCDQLVEVSLLDNVTMIFIGLKLAHTNRFFSQTNFRMERFDFLSVHTIRFSLQFFVYDKKSVRVLSALRPVFIYKEGMQYFRRAYVSLATFSIVISLPRRVGSVLSS